MAAKVILVTGGVRSGKSSYAETLANHYPGVVYLATAWAGDEEMADRIRQHQSRRPASWRTIEERIDLAQILAQNHETDCFLIDCLGMWVTNVLGQPHANLEGELAALLKEIESFPGVVIIVSNEVGWGLVPVNELGRRFRDLLGRVNCKVAWAADTVVLMVAGCPLYVKGREEKPGGL